MRTKAIQTGVVAGPLVLTDRAKEGFFLLISEYLRLRALDAESSESRGESGSERIVCHGLPIIEAIDKDTNCANK